MYITNFGQLQEYANNSSSSTLKSNSLSYLYYGCKHIGYVGQNNFGDLTNITNIDYIFAESSAEGINSGTFDLLLDLESMEYAFKNCVNITEIPNNLFANNELVTNIEGLFQGCTSLTTIPTNIFSEMSGLTSVDNVFKGCPIKTGTAIDFSNAPNISSAVDFLGVPSNYTIIVSSDTVTETTFRNLGYNILIGNIFKFTVDTEATTAGAVLTGIPFNMYSCNANTELYVDWGDGNTSTLSKSSGYNYTNYNSSTEPSTHTYEIPGIYHITITSNNWNDIRWLSTSNGTSSYNYSSFSYARYYCRDLFNKTCISIDSLLPKMYGKNYYTGTGSSSSINSISNMNGMFYGTTKLVSIPNNLFIFSNITSFYYMFASCTSLTSISQDLFKYNTDVTSFQSCFASCYSLTSIPTDLFKYNTVVTNFQSCFYGCSSLTSLPTDLFKYNTAVTNFYSCFYSCSSLTSLPTDLFKYNTAVTDFSYCFSNCFSLMNFKLIICSTNVSTVASIITKNENAIRKICVPANSTTYTTFNNNKTTYGYELYTLDECNEYVEYAINTQATTSGAKLGAIPLRNLSNDYPITVDWGDNNSNTLYANDFTVYGYTHEYAIAGIYTITVEYEKPEYVELISVMGDDIVTETEPVRIFRETLIDNQ